MSRTKEVCSQIKDYSFDYDSKTKRTNQLLESIAITNAEILDKLNDISKQLKEKND